MEKNLVLEDAQGTIIRVIPWDGAAAKVIRRADTRRLELVKDLAYFEHHKIDFDDLGEITTDTIVKTPYLVGQLGHLKVLDNTDAILKDSEGQNESNRNWWLSLAGVALLTVVSMSVISRMPHTTPKIEEELKQHVVKIVKHLKRPETLKINAPTPTVATESNANAKVNPSKITGLKRMGALSALGSLKSGKQMGGLDIGAAQTSAGPGLGGGTQGSGGIQTSLYAKGIVGAALGAGNNVNGAGGYGTKGKGGGQAGYGKLSLVGSTGASPIPLGAEASVAKGLDRDQIAAVINRNLGQVRFCYEQGLQGDASLGGRVAVAFVIGGSGMVKTAAIDSTTMNAKGVEDCIVMRLKTWKFPVPDGGVDVQVTYPFVLKRSGQG